MSRDVRTLGLATAVKLPQLTLIPELTFKRNGKKATLKQNLLSRTVTIDDLYLIRKQVRFFIYSVGIKSTRCFKRTQLKFIGILEEIITFESI